MFSTFYWSVSVVVNNVFEDEIRGFLASEEVMTGFRVERYNSIAVLDLSPVYFGRD